jgi:hypothetical protein
MAAGGLMDEGQQQDSSRDKTLKTSQIDEDYISSLVREGWRKANIEREDWLERKEGYEQSWRDLTAHEDNGPWENASTYHVPVTLTYGKAVHARLWQLFSNPNGFFSVESKTEAFKDKETTIKQFMDWVMEQQCNSQMGARREIDRWLWDVVMGGSGYLKGYWKKEVRRYRDVVPVIEQTETLSFDPMNLTGVPKSDVKSKTIEKEVEKVEVLQTPQLKRILHEDIVLPIGQHDPQDSDWVMTRVYMSDDDLKVRAEQGTFWKGAVEACLGHKEDIYRQAMNGEQTGQIKYDRTFMDGFETDAYANEMHVIFEWYGKAYVEEGDVNEIVFNKDISKQKEEIVAWVHHGTGRVLGWTYLARISPSAIRPIFKADFVTFPDRSNGVGVAELLYDIGRNIDAVYNLRFDNGQLASIPMFAYRSGSSLKPHLMRIRPGTGIPVDDVNDIKQFSFPYLTSFGYQEEQQLTQYSEKLLSIGELQLGRAPDKVGALRNATGSNLIASESSIQLEIHFDRIAHCMGRVLQFIFRLCRERMDGDIFFRVTGDRGEPVFGEVNRQDLMGEYDFKVSVDILGQSQQEKQQMATLAMQTLISPAFMQTGVVSPTNLYELAKNFLKANRLSRIDNYITPPQGFEGDIILPQERIHRILIGADENPPIEDTVRLSEDHDKALSIYDSFKESEQYALFNPYQVARLESLIQRHQQIMLAAQSGGNPNITGMQVPREGFSGLEAAIGGTTGAIQAPVGEANGPVV